jgi:hypothetical protein
MTQNIHITGRTLSQNFHLTGAKGKSRRRRKKEDRTGPHSTKEWNNKNHKCRSYNKI